MPVAHVDGYRTMIDPDAIKSAKPAKAVKAQPAKSGLSATSIVALGSQIAKAEAELAVLKAMIRTLK